MDTNAWEEKYKPISNHLDKNASWDGIMFETYGEELEFVLAQKPELVWTYCDPVDEDDDDENSTPIIMSGYHLTNRIGYFITSVPHTGEPIVIKLESDNDE